MDQEARQEPTLEVVLPQQAVLSDLPPELLAPEALPGLWQDGRLTLKQAKGYFNGNHAATIAHDGWEEQVPIPRCYGAILKPALAEAVRQGIAWLANGPTSYWKEGVTTAVLDEQAVLLPPPEPIAPADLTPSSLPAAWADDETSGAAIVRALSQQRGVALPWGLVRDGLREAVRSRWLQTVSGGDAVAEFDTAGSWRLCAPDAVGPPAPAPQAAAVELEAHQVQDLAERVPQLLEASAGHGLRFRVGVALDASAPAPVRQKVDELLDSAVPDMKSEIRAGSKAS